MTAQHTSFGQSVRAARQKAGLGLRPLAQRSGIHYTGLRQLENGDFNPTLATALRLVSQVTGGNEAREKLLRLYLRKPRAGLLAHLLVAAALRRGGLKVTRQTKNQSRKSPIFDIVVDAGEHLKIGIVVKVIKRE
ncbi:MAG: helix-turn-helix transcriptional regulator [Verrucomicrobiota bacterium]